MPILLVYLCDELKRGFSPERRNKSSIRFVREAKFGSQHETKIRRSDALCIEVKADNERDANLLHVLVTYSDLPPA